MLLFLETGSGVAGNYNAARVYATFFPASAMLHKPNQGIT
jgi:hypothetical protein|tara:strand:- start:872 stop:991 length:120 start_codon:yes stop_codon:yes gene_type:complete